MAQRYHPCNEEWISLHLSMIWSTEGPFPQVRAGATSTASYRAVHGSHSPPWPQLLPSHLSHAHLWNLTRHDVTELWYHCKLRTFVSEHLGASAHFVHSLITEDSGVSWWEGWGRNPRKCDLWWGRKSWVPALVPWGSTPSLVAILAGEHISKRCSRTQDWVKPFGVGKNNVFLGGSFMLA